MGQSDQLKFNKAYKCYQNLEKLFTKNKKIMKQINHCYFKKMAQFFDNLQKISDKDVINCSRDDKNKFQRFKTKILNSYLKKNDKMFFKQIYEYSKSNDIW